MLKHKDLISINDLTKKEIQEILAVAKAIKQKQKSGISYTPLKGKTLGMIFVKPSTRTRVSFEVGMYQLGGHALFLSHDDLQLNRGETIYDTARTLSRYLDGIIVRTFDHKDVLDMAKYASVPVINGLTNLLHPCQVLADIFTITEKKGSLKGLKIVYIGDGNNVANSWAYAAAKLGLNMVLCTPKSYAPDKKVIKQAQETTGSTGASICLMDDPQEAVKGADVIYTDVWISMGKESEKAKRIKAFSKYQINGSLLSKADKDVIVMHCLPAHRSEEITDDVIDSRHSVVFDQAENRLHVQKAVLALLMGKSKK